MITEAMITRAQALVDKNEVEYHHTNANTHYFIGNGHSGREDKEYEIRAEIQKNNEIEWVCDCVHAQYNDECKHMLACQILMKQWVGTNKELRDEYKALSIDVDKNHHDDKVVGKIKIESDDD